MSEKSKVLTELDFLAALEHGEVVTQMTLSKRISVSIGLINALIKRATHKGYVKAKAAPYKRYAYYLTPRGFTEKGRLVAEYLESSLGFFRTARREYSELFNRGRDRGMRRFALVGGGELAEIALLAAREAEVEVDMIFDRETNKGKVHGLDVARTPIELSMVDGLVITDTLAPQQAFDSMSEHFAESRILAPPLLRISRSPLDLRSKAAQR